MPEKLEAGEASDPFISLLNKSSNVNKSKTKAGPFSPSHHHQKNLF